MFGIPSQNPIKEYKIGLPCMLGEVVGRIIGEDENGSWGFINDIKMFSIPLFSTPHGTVIKTGVLTLSEITKEGELQLIEYEDDILSNGGQLYNGKLPDLFLPPIIETWISKVKFVDKWVEFWFNEPYPLPVDLNDPDSYQLSSKSKYLWDAVSIAGIYDDIMSNGFCGRKLTWKLLGQNYEIIKIE